MDNPERRVVAAAMLVKTHSGDLTCSVPAPGRHHNVIYALHRLGVEPNDVDRAVHGFLLNDGTFVNRKEACLIARAAGQIVRRCGGDEHALYSENLW